PGELPGAMHGDGLRSVSGLIHDLDLAGLDDEELEVAVTDVEEHFSVPVALEGRMGTAHQRGDLGILEPGEGDHVQVVLSHPRTIHDSCAESYPLPDLLGWQHARRDSRRPYRSAPGRLPRPPRPARDPQRP